MEITEFEDYGQFVDLTLQHPNDLINLDNRDSIYSPTSHNKYYTASIQNTSYDMYQNPHHNSICESISSNDTVKPHLTTLWVCCKLLSRTEIIENCIIPACITVGTVYCVYYLYC